MALPPTNFSVLEGAGGRPTVGDVFEACLAGHRLIGRVISTDTWMADYLPRKYLMIYVFHPVPKIWTLNDRNALKIDQLLVRPLITDSTAWRRKYFRKVGNLDFASDERLEPTSFWLTSAGEQDGLWVDEYRREVETATQPSGYATGTPYLMLDDLASDALGVPRAFGEKPAVSWRFDGDEHWVRIDCEAVTTSAVIKNLGHEPNGYFWSALLSFARPDLMADIESDPEAGSVHFYGSSAAIMKLRPAVQSRVDDANEITRHVKNAGTAGVELDD